MVTLGYGEPNSGHYQWVPFGFYPNTRRFTAALITIYKVCCQVRDGNLAITLEDADLVKHFCQRRRKFHSPTLYRLVLDLHRLIQQRHLSVNLCGGLPVADSQQPEICDALATMWV